MKIRLEYFYIIFLVALLPVFLDALFQTSGILFVMFVLLLAGTGALLGLIVGKMKTGQKLF